MSTHLATLLEQVADAIPDDVALRQGDRTSTYRELADRSARLARSLQEAGLSAGSRVAIYLYNSPEYLEVLYAALKLRAVPININYRYLADELTHVFNDAEVEAVVYGSDFAPRMEEVRGRIPTLRALYQVGGDDLPADVARYEDAIASSRPAERIPRHDEDLWLVYTGGTTGMPKGVPYRVGYFSQFMMGSAAQMMFGLPSDLPVEAGPRVSAIKELGLQPVSVPACPLMHNAGLNLGANPALLSGGTVELLVTPGFDADEFLATVDRVGVTSTTIVGDAFAKPMVLALEAAAAGGKPYDGSSLKILTSGGAALSPAVQHALFSYLPDLTIMDSSGATECTYGFAFRRRGEEIRPGNFPPVPGLLILDADGDPIPQDRAETGLIAAPSFVSSYHNSPEKSAATFREIDGMAYVIPGDMGYWEPDGTLTMLGRGSACINTGGEKVYPDEVEGVIRSHPQVADCIVVGLPDDRWGEIVSALVVPVPGANISEQEVIDLVKGTLASYKAPRRVFMVESVPRAPTGKADHAEAGRLARSLA